MDSSFRALVTLDLHHKLHSLSTEKAILLQVRGASLRHMLSTPSRPLWTIIRKI
jgi:hypothetical protein